MKPNELLEEWTSGESSGMRPRRVQQVRDDLLEYTDVFIPRRISEIESMVERMKGEITKQLREAAEESDEESEDDESTDSEEDAESGE